MITSHYFNNCHWKEVRQLLFEMLIASWSLACFCFASSFHLNTSGEGITRNFNTKVCILNKVSAIHLALLHQAWSYSRKQVVSFFLKFLYLFTTPLVTVLLLVAVITTVQCVVGDPLILMFSKDSKTNSCSHEGLRGLDLQRAGNIS